MGIIVGSIEQLAVVGIYTNTVTEAAEWHFEPTFITPKKYKAQRGVFINKKGFLGFQTHTSLLSVR